MSGDRMLTPYEVGQMAGVTTKTVTRWAKRGWLAHVTTPGGHRRYPESEVRALLDRGRS